MFYENITRGIDAYECSDAYLGALIHTKSLLTEKAKENDDDLEKFFATVEKEILRLFSGGRAESIFDLAMDMFNEIPKYEQNFFLSTFVVGDYILDVKRRVKEADPRQLRRAMRYSFESAVINFGMAQHAVGAFGAQTKIHDEAYAIIYMSYVSTLMDYIIDDNENTEFDFTVENTMEKLRKTLRQIKKDVAGMKKEKEQQEIESRILKRRNEELKEQLRSRPAENAADLKKERYEKEKEIQGLSEKIEELTKELAEARAENAELNELLVLADRELQGLDIEDEEYEDVEINDEVNSEVFEKKFLFVGGHKSVLRKLREKFPNSRFIDSATEKVSGTHLQQYEYIVYLARYVSHAIYNKIRMENKGEVKEIHIPASGEKTIIKTIIKTITEESSEEGNL